MLSIVTIDGPAGAGKSSVARQLAERLGFRFLDTGAMYRAVTWAALDSGADLDDEKALARLAEGLKLDFGPEGEVLVADRDLAREIRSAEVTASVSKVAAAGGVRKAMSSAQREIGERGELVCEGRDMGTFVFPDAAVRFYLDASAEVRAERRYKEFLEAGRGVEFKELLEEIRERDRADSERKVAPLMRIDEQIYVDSSAMSRDDVIDTLERLARTGLLLD
ncbi:MAG: (d)CMP kinase [Planctomycetota bacterium]